MGKQKIRIKINGSDMEADVEPRLLLVHCIRDVFGVEPSIVRLAATSAPR